MIESIFTLETTFLCFFSLFVFFSISFNNKNNTYRVLDYLIESVFLVLLIIIIEKYNIFSNQQTFQEHKFLFWIISFMFIRSIFVFFLNIIDITFIQFSKKITNTIFKKINLK